MSPETTSKVISVKGLKTSLIWIWRKSSWMLLPLVLTLWSVFIIQTKKIFLTLFSSQLYTDLSWSFSFFHSEHQMIIRILDFNLMGKIWRVCSWNCVYTLNMGGAFKDKIKENEKRTVNYWVLLKNWVVMKSNSCGYWLYTQWSVWKAFVLEEEQGLYREKGKIQC